MREILVIGAGAAGMMAAVSAAEAGASVILLERNEKAGKKLYITVKGRCNVTNDCEIDDFLREVPRNPRFLYAALSDFAPKDMMAFLEAEGCPVVVQRGRRVFPASEKASDVTKALLRAMSERGVRLRLNTRVRRLLTESGRCAGVETADGETLRADGVILCTGGLTVPATGSDGGGHRMAESTGHTVTACRPSLSALETAEEWPARLQGLSLKNVRLTLKEKKRVLYTELGEMLFTHFGISGPLVLEMSCHLPDDWSDCRVSLDLKPGLTPEQVDARLQRDLAAAPRKRLSGVMPGLLPASFAALFPSLCGVDAGQTCATVSRADRLKLCETLKNLPVTLKALRPMEEAIITRGGVSVRDVHPGTMESKRLPGLWFAGELLDVDAHTGGYNLQIAFSTGHLAGKSAAREP